MSKPRNLSNTRPATIHSQMLHEGQLMTSRFEATILDQIHRLNNNIQHMVGASERQQQELSGVVLSMSQLQSAVSELANRVDQMSAGEELSRVRKPSKGKTVKQSRPQSGRKDTPRNSARIATDRARQPATLGRPNPISDVSLHNIPISESLVENFTKRDVRDSLRQSKHPKEQPFKSLVSKEIVDAKPAQKQQISARIEQLKRVMAELQYHLRQVVEQIERRPLELQALYREIEVQRERQQQGDTKASQVIEELKQYQIRSVGILIDLQSKRKALQEEIDRVRKLFVDAERQLSRMFEAGEEAGFEVEQPIVDPTSKQPSPENYQPLEATVTYAPQSRSHELPRPPQIELQRQPIYLRDMQRGLFLEVAGDGIKITLDPTQPNERIAERAEPVLERLARMQQPVREPLRQTIYEEPQARMKKVFHEEENPRFSMKSCSIYQREERPSRMQQLRQMEQPLRMRAEPVRLMEMERPKMMMKRVDSNMYKAQRVARSARQTARSNSSVSSTSKDSDQKVDATTDQNKQPPVGAPLLLNQTVSMPQQIDPPAQLHKYMSLPPEAEIVTTQPTPEPAHVKHDVSGSNRMALVHFEEKEILVEIEPIVRKISSMKREFGLEAAKLTISKWVAAVYDTLARETFSGYLSHHLSEPDSKVFFTHNLALNFAQMTDYFWQNHNHLWQEHRQPLIRHFEQESTRTLDFMMVKYPQKKKTTISEEIRAAIPALDQSEDPAYDFVHNSRKYFQYDPTTQSYAPAVKAMLNALMTESQKYLPAFRNIVGELFTVGEGASAHKLKHLIGMKFKENTPQYSKRELGEPGIQPKSPEVLRVIIKWTEELEKKVRNLASGRTIHNSFAVRNEQSQQLNRFHKQALRKFMQEKEKQLDAAGRQMRLRIRSVLALMPDFTEKYSEEFAYISPSEVQSGLLSYVLSETASNLSVSYMLFIIDLLEEAAIRTCPFFGKGVQKSTDATGNVFVDQVEYRHFSFVSFTISDLLRCKCSGTLAQIKEVWEKLKIHPSLKVYRVKNRLDTSNRDFLVNARLVGTNLLCELQLAVTEKAGDEKSNCLSHFSHFMYELSRASYGPIAEAVIINTYLTEFSSFFRDQLNRLSESCKAITSAKVECVGNAAVVEGYLLRDNLFSFVCSNCLQLRLAYSRHLGNFDSSGSTLAKDPIVEQNQQVKDMVCGDCVLVSLSPTARAAWSIGAPLCQFFIAKHPTERLTEDYLCIINRTGPVRHILTVQLVKAKQLYVPVFYECVSEKSQFSESDLVKNYFIFKLQDGVQLESVQASAVENATDGKLNGKPFVFSTEEARNNWKNITAKSVVAATSSTSANTLLMTSLLEASELADLVHRNKQFKDVEITLMLKQPVWRLEQNDLGDDSFRVPQLDSDLTHLKQLIASDNRITTVTLVSSSTLKRLDLSSNRIVELELRPTDYPKLEELELTINRVSKIIALEHNSLKKVYLGNNSLTTANELQWKLPELEHLQLCSNKLEDFILPLMKCPKLKQLDLWKNPLKAIDLGIHAQLQSVSATDCQLVSVDLSFCKLDRLKKLNLARNRLTELLLDEFPRLADLNVSENQLASLDLRGIPRLKRLIAFSNQLHSLDFANDSELKECLLADNRLKQLNLYKKSLPALKVLDVNHNQLTNFSLPEQVSQLKVLKLSDFTFPALHLEHCDFLRLKILSLASDKLERLEIPHRLPKLKELHLKDHQIKQFAFGQYDLHELEVVELVGLEMCKLQFDRNLPKLQTLIINRVARQDLSLNQLNFLRVLDLSSCCLSDNLDLPQQLSGLKALVLANNRLRSIQLRDRELTQLITIDLSINELERVEFDERHVMASLELFDFRCNPLPLRRVANFAVEKGSFFPSLKEVREGAGGSIAALAMWSFLRMGWGQREELYKKLQQTAGKAFNGRVVEDVIQSNANILTEAAKFDGETVKQLQALVRMLLKMNHVAVANNREEAQRLLQQ